MALVLPKTCSMGGSNTGLVGTIGVALLNPDGTVHTARAIADIYEIGGGCYGKNISFPDNWAGSLKWDTGGGSPVYACEEYTTDGLVDGIPEAVQIFEDTVTIDSVNGTAGTAFPIGTHAYPVDNLTDALTICVARGLDIILLHTNLIVGAGHNVDGLSIKTHGIQGISVTFQSGCSANKTVVRYADVSGVITAGDVILLEYCAVGALANFAGTMNLCTLGEGCEVSLHSTTNMYDCYCGGESGNEPEINLGTAGLAMPCYCGNLKFTGKTGGPRTVASFRSGKVWIASSCVAGIIEILGTGELEKDESGAGCTVDVDAALTNEFIADHVWDEAVGDHAAAGSFGKLLAFVKAKLGFIAKEF